MTSHLRGSNTCNFPVTAAWWYLCSQSRWPPVKSCKLCWETMLLCSHHNYHCSFFLCFSLSLFFFCRRWLQVLEQGVSLCPYLSLSVPVFTLTTMLGIIRGVLMSCFQDLLPGYRNSSVVLRWALNSLNFTAHSLQAAKMIAVPYIAVWLNTVMRKVWHFDREIQSPFLFLILAPLSSSLPVSAFCCCISSPQHSSPSDLINTYYSTKSN